MRSKLSKDIEKLTRKLVSIKSVCGSAEGEKNIAEYINAWFLKLPYFKEHPDRTFTFKCGDKGLSNIAYIKGQSNKTIILMGHIDTVDTKDYGKIEKLATDTVKLPQALKDNFKLTKEVIRDIDSGKYLFGRGALDMKAGVAAYMAVMKHFARHPERLNGSLVLLNECDEEGNSSGVISALEVLKELKDREGLEYVACINGDYSTSDTNERNVYLGTVGKLLPCFVAIGKESHVGDPFAALDPNLLLSLINKNITLNMDLADHAGNKTTVPPISLKQSDNKDLYTVQTALSGIAYYNFMTYVSSPKEILAKCVKIARDSFDEALALMNDNYEKYRLENGLDHKKPPYKTRVYTYKEWCRLLSAKTSFKEEMERYSKKLLKDDPHIDMREYSYKMINRSYDFYDKKEPVIIVFFASMFYSSIDTVDKKLIRAVETAVDKVNQASAYDIRTSRFYPYISDMSFMSLPFAVKDIEDMLANMPYAIAYPYKTIKEINVPVVNIGTYGKDGHTFIERLEKDYSFNELPELLQETIMNYFGS